MVQKTLILGFDLGTSATTSRHALVRDSFDNQGKLRREILGSVAYVTDWPGCIEGATGSDCVPTDLVYHRVTRELLSWGFEAQQYLNDSFNDIPFSDVFVVETIKLLLPDPDEAKVPSAASERYRALRKTLTATLNKNPYEVFEDLLSRVLAHVLDHAKRKYAISLHNYQIELVLAFPSGWCDRIHTTVARIGARALQNAIATHGLRNMIFGIENVYTVSETLCSAKEWLRETVAHASSVDYETPTTNLDDLNEGDCFLPIDIGGGTGCLTPLKLLSKSPLGVEQLDKTQSLEVSGEAVQAEFERRLRAKITKKDYPGDLERAIYQICRKFKDEKKRCGDQLGPGSRTWNCPVTRLKANPRKGFEKDCMKFNRKEIEECFDPVIDVLDRAIEETMRKFPSIKAIVFLGQFGGSSKYLKKRMESSPISGQVKIRQSQNGKLGVVEGAISERLKLEETFVRSFKTLKSYGTLVTLMYSDEVARIFPNPQAHGAQPFERANDGLRLKVIEWAFPKETIIHDGRAHDIGKDGLRHHTWPFSEDDLGFWDTIIVSDEDVPAPQLDGMSYTLWTEAHQNNELYIAGQRKQVQQIEFGWDLKMSQKIDAQGNIVGPYGRDDLRAFRFPEKKVKDRRRRKLRELDYDLVWEITEMQVKLYVQAIFPNQVGSPLSQLAREQALGPDEKTISGESRSKALHKDIEIANRANEEDDDDDDENEDEDAFGDQWRNMPRNTHAPTAHRPDPNQVQEQSQQRMDSAEGAIPRQSATTPSLPQHNTQPLARVSPPRDSRRDGRRRVDCLTCKDLEKKCDGVYLFDNTSGTHKCNTCLRVGKRCDVTEPDWAHDVVQRESQQVERRGLGKGKSRDESENSESASRGRSMTVTAADTVFQSAVLRSTETPMAVLSSQLMGQTENSISVQRRRFTAIRGGKEGSKRARNRY